MAGTLRRRLAGVSTLLVWGIVVAAGPVGAANNPAIDAAIKRENTLHRKNLMELTKQEIDAKAQEDIGTRNCRSDQGCKKQVQEQYLARIREITNQKTEEGARYNKALIDIQEGALDEEGQGYLKGRVEENVGTPPEPPSGPLVDLSNAIDQLAPHYDMTRPHEGLRVMTDIVTGMGLGYLAKGLGFGLKNAMGKLTGKVAQEVAEAAPPIRSWTPPGGAPELPGAGGPRTPTPGTGGSPKTPTPVTGGGSGIPTPAPGGGTGTAPPVGGGGPTGGSFPPGAIVPPRTLPPGVQVPDVVRNTPRPLHLQQRPTSCGHACIKMVAETVKRRSLPESFYRQISRGPWGQNPGKYDPNLGTELTNLADVMKKAGLKARVIGAPENPTLADLNRSIDQIVQSTKNGYPAVVHTGSMAKGHYVVVDAVVGSPGNRSFFIRDPLNLAHVPDGATRQMLIDSGFSNFPVMTEQEFLGAFKGWGVVLGP